jgi:hypothetical protein
MDFFNIQDGFGVALLFARRGRLRLNGRIVGPCGNRRADCSLGIALRGGNITYKCCKCFQFLAAHGYWRHSTLSHSGNRMLQHCDYRRGCEALSGKSGSCCCSRDAIASVTFGAAVCFEANFSLAFQFVYCRRSCSCCFRFFRRRGGRAGCRRCCCSGRCSPEAAHIGNQCFHISRI